MKVKIYIYPIAWILLLIFLTCCGSRDNGGDRDREVELTDIVAFKNYVGDSLPSDSVKAQMVLRRELLYDKYTLSDTFPYRDTVRVIQWVKIRRGLEFVDSLMKRSSQWGILCNRKNINGEAPLVRKYSRNAFRRIEDEYGTERYQGIPLYNTLETIDMPVRYALDGSLVKFGMPAVDTAFSKVSPAYIGGEWFVPARYTKIIGNDSLKFDKVIFVDRTNQTIVTIEKSVGEWLVRSVNPATTGRHHPPYQQSTPLGIFVVQEKKSKMIFLKDGTTVKGGFAPYASRFSNGGYVHGVPVNEPNKNHIEFSWSLGTTPRSHMCVRTATSHAEYVYNWATVERCLVFVIE